MGGDSDIRDFGIAVADALRLNDCHNAMAFEFAKHPAIEGDEQRWVRRISVPDASPEDNAWVHFCNSQDVAVSLIRQGMMMRQLPMWIRTSTGDELVDYYQFLTIPHRMITAGIYLTDNVPKGNLEYRPLWVKRSDWLLFFDATMIGRYGASPLVDQAPASGLPKRAPSYKRGSPPTDDEIIAMARAMHAEGLNTRQIDKQMRHRPGFENVATRDVRKLITGLFPRTGRGPRVE